MFVLLLLPFTTTLRQILNIYGILIELEGKKIYEFFFSKKTIRIRIFF